MNPLEQQQHRLPQVYLKQFGYIKNGKWWCKYPFFQTVQIRVFC